MGHYNEQLVNSVLESFKEEMKTYDGERTIMFDADNTLYLFSRYNDIDGALGSMHNRGFFKNLPVFQEAPDVVTNLQRFGLRVGVITSSIGGYSVTEKRESLNYHFPMIDNKDIYILEPGIGKTELELDYKHTILVDDYYANIMYWYIAGGVAIKKSYSGKKRPVPVVTSLIDLFPVLRELNFI